MMKLAKNKQSKWKSQIWKNLTQHFKFKHEF